MHSQGKLLKFDCASQSQNPNKKSHRKHNEFFIKVKVTCTHANLIKHESSFTPSDTTPYQSVHYTTPQKKEAFYTEELFSISKDFFIPLFFFLDIIAFEFFFLEIHAPIPIKNFIYFTDFLARVISRSPVFSCDEKQKTENSPR